MKTGIPVLILMAFAGMACAQGMQVGEVIMVSTSPLKKDVKPEALQADMRAISSSWNKGKKGLAVGLFQADRGNRKGDFMLVCIAKKASDRSTLPAGSPFTDQVLSAGTKRPSDFLSNPASFTEYRLIGADKLMSLPVTGLLGMHYIQVKKDRAEAFEKFVVEKLHPAVGQLLPDMQLLYFKAVAGDQAGSYITIFTIESSSARHKYWPAGAPETEILKQAFRPVQPLGVELGSYLVEDSYLLPAGGAAAYYESKEWTDFILQ